MPRYCFFATDNLDHAIAFRQKSAAIDNYRALLAEHLRYGEPHNAPQASLHYANRRSEIDEYPDFILSCGPRGGVVCERA